MVISWDSPVGRKLHKEIVKGLVDDMTKERWISVEDFEKAKKALTEADLGYPYAKVDPEALNAYRIALEASEKGTGAFVEGESYPPSQS